MELSGSLLKKFSDTVNPETEDVGSFVYGTAALSGSKEYVQIDGSSFLTPISTTADVEAGDRVLVYLQDHTATVLGNATVPSTGRLSTVLTNGLDYDSLSVGDLYAVNATIDNLFANYIEADTVLAKYLEANYAKIDDLDVIHEYVNDLEADTVTIYDHLSALDADITTLRSESITTDYLSANYADIGLLNVETISAQNLLARTGVIDNATIENGYITGTLYGITISADYITSGTIDAGEINVVNLNCANLTVGYINGAQIAESTIDWDNLGVNVTSVIDEMQDDVSSALEEAGLSYTKATEVESKAVYSTTVMYALSDSYETAPVSGWVQYTDLVFTNGLYIWEKTVTVFGDGSSSETNPLCVSGKNGSNGSSIEIAETSVTYQASSSGSSVPTGDWKSSVSEVNVSQGQYLWTRTIVTCLITASDGSTMTDSTTSYGVAYIGIDGETGAAGENGLNGASVEILSSEVTYQASSSGTLTPTGSWSSSLPSVSQGNYLWTRTIVTYLLTASDGSTSTETTTSYSVSYVGVDGEDGEDGANGVDGVGISSIYPEYYLSTSKTTQSGGSWTANTAPTWTDGYYMWTRTVIVYTDGSVTRTDPIVDTSWEVANDVLTIANGKTTAYYSDSAPSGSSFSTDDIWFDTDDGYKMYYWNGSKWVATEFGTDAIAAEAITAGKIAASAITTGKIAASAITTGKIAAEAITANEIASGTITSAEIAAGSITAACIDTTNLKSYFISAEFITGEMITTDTINADSIKTASITATQIHAGAIGTSEIAANAVTAAKIDVDELSAISANFGTMVFKGYLTTNENRTKYNDNETTGMTMTPSGIGAYTSGSKYWNLSASGEFEAVGATIHGSIVSDSSSFKIAVNNGRIYTYYSDAEIGRITVVDASTDSEGGAMYGIGAGVSSKGIAFGQLAKEETPATFTTVYYINYGVNPDGYTEQHIFYGRERHISRVYFGSSDAYLYGQTAFTAISIEGGLTTTSSVLIGNKYHGTSITSYALDVIGGAYFTGNINTEGAQINSGIDSSTQHQYCRVRNATCALSLYQNYGGNGGLYDHTNGIAFVSHNPSSGATTFGNSAYATTISGSSVTISGYYPQYLYYSGTGQVYVTSSHFMPVSTGNLYCGGSEHLWIRVYAQNSSISTSDYYDKTNIEDLDERYENLFMLLKPVNYMLKNLKTGDNHDRTHCGLIAQWTLEAAEQCGLDTMTFAAICRDDLETPTQDGRTERYGMAYDELIGLTIHMTQKTIYRVTDTETRIQSLEDQVKELQEEIAKLKEKQAAA